MLSALIFASFLTPAAVDSTAPESNEPVFLQTGDVLCIGYERENNSCLVKQTITRSDSTGTVTLEEMLLTDFGAPLKLTTLSTAERRGSRYCLVPKTIRAVTVPEIHHAGPLLSIATVEGLNRYAAADYCVTHRRCGEAHVSIAYSGKNRFAAEDTIYTLFKNDDPRAASLDIRPLEMKALEPIKGFAPISCLPDA